MKNLIKTASVLDKVLHILSIATMIGAISCIVGLCIIAAGVIFDLPPHLIGTGFQNITVGFLKLSLSDTHMPDFHSILLWNAAVLFLTFLCLIIAKKMVDCFRSILTPMKAGAPFDNAVSRNLKTLAKYTCILGIFVNIENTASNFLLEITYNLSDVLLGDQITHISVNNYFDLSFLFIAGILLLLSLVFRYGEELQQLSDETL